MSEILSYEELEAKMWYTEHQRDKLEKELSILREALEQIAEPMNYAWYEKAEDGEAVIETMREMARMALQKAGGEGWKKL